MKYTVLHTRDFPEPLGDQLDDFYQQIKMEEVKQAFVCGTVAQRLRVQAFVRENEGKLRTAGAGEMVDFIIR